MKKPWSISTTVRNPERVRGFLQVLKLLEGESFSNQNQIKYQILLIQNRLYKPTNLTEDQQEYFKEIEKNMPFSVASDIFYANEYKDPPMRGRQSVAPLNKIGLCIAKTAAEAIEITELGRYFLTEDYDLGKLFFILFLKWQLPNPDSTAFREEDGFAVKPFVGALHLIDQTNRAWEKLGNNPVGITKEEFSLFAPTLINYQNISAQAERLIDFRTRLQNCKTSEEQKEFRERYKRLFAEEFLGTRDTNAVNSLLKNLREYGDNTIRYFRLTRYVYVRGGGFHIDLEARRSVEINRLLETDNAAPLSFANVNEYRAYLADIHQPVLPWETEEELKRIIENILTDVEHLKENLISKKVGFAAFRYRKTKELSKEGLERYIEELRNYRRRLQDAEIHYESQNIGTIERYIDDLKNIHSSGSKKSIELERLATMALNVLNDALEINPNYPVGDDNEPTFTAPGGKPDIECFYEKFNAICEVTTLINRTQWYYEGQPVMRHIRDFEDANTEKKAYCLFVAPKLHQDTIETFWMSIKYGYRGVKQRIIPLTISQLIGLLEVLLEIKQQGRSFKHTELLKLYDDILEITSGVSHSDLWMKKIPSVLDDWKRTTLGKQVGS